MYSMCVKGNGPISCNLVSPPGPLADRPASPLFLAAKIGGYAVTYLHRVLQYSTVQYVKVAPIQYNTLVGTERIRWL